MKKLFFVIVVALLVSNIVFAEKIKTESAVLDYGKTATLNFKEGTHFEIRVHESTQIDFSINHAGLGSIIIDEIGNKEIKTRIKRRDLKYESYVLKVGENTKVDIVQSKGPDISVNPTVVHYEDDKKARTVVLYFNAFAKIRTGQSFDEFKTEMAKNNSANTSGITGAAVVDKAAQTSKDYTVFFIVLIAVLVLLFVYFKFIKSDNGKEEKSSEKIDEEDVYVTKDAKTVKFETTKSEEVKDHPNVDLVEPKKKKK